jgi:hypothetical protein
MKGAIDWLGLGLYMAAEASRLLDLPPAKVRRWLGGYDYVHRGEQHRADPLWSLQLPKLDGQLGLGFLDLMQLMLVARFIAEGILQAMRLALARAAEVPGQHHPFTATTFKTDGRRIFLEIADETGERASRPERSDAAALVNCGERDRGGDRDEAQVGIADQVLDDPARAVAPPVLHAPLLARDQQNLLDRRQLAVVVELAAAVVQLGRGGQHLDDQNWLGDVATAGIGRSACYRQVELIKRVVASREPDAELAKDATRRAAADCGSPRPGS